MAKNNPISDINVRKQMLKLHIRQQEMEITNSVRQIGEYFTLPTLKNSLFQYVANNPDTAFRAGLMAVNIFSKLFQGKKKRTTRRK